MVHTPELKIVVFGDATGEHWGIVVTGDRPSLAMGSMDEVGPALPVAKSPVGADDLLSVAGADIRLRVLPAPRPAAETSAAGLLQRVKVAVTTEVKETARPQELSGLMLDGPCEHQTQGVRLVAMWFPDGPELGLVSIRTDPHRRHDRDRREAFLTNAEHPIVVDPRLSTTYDAGGSPIRVGVELWLVDAEDDDDQWPSRMAAFAAGPKASLPVSEHSLSAYALRCADHGEKGVGVYLVLDCS
ncbi:MAG: hypothetical protein ACP5H2_01785 [Solirubrobacteraceae bacterium]